MTAPATAVLGAAALAALALAGCETTQQKSARLSKEAKGKLNAKGLVVSRENPDVRIEQTAVVQDANGVAAIVRVRNTGPATQVRLPVSIAVKDAKGRDVYRNDAAGLEPALVGLPVLERGQELYWVDNQIIVSGRVRGVEAKVGAARGRATAAVPRVTISRVAVGRDADGTYAKGLVRNESEIAQKRLTIFCVARRGDRVVAAGRAVVEKLPPRSQARRPTTFTVFFIGNPRGAKLSFSAPATVLQGGAR